MGKHKNRMTTDVDVVIGKQIRTLRILNKMSQQDLGDKVGITFQQIQKYEKGTNRICASRLYEVSKIFNVPVSAFYVVDPRLDLADGKSSSCSKILKHWAKLKTQKGRDMATAVVRILATFDLEECM